MIKQQANPDIQAVKRYVEQGSCPHGAEQSTITAGTIRLLKQYKRLCVWEGVLWRRVIESNRHKQMFQIMPRSKVTRGVETAPRGRGTCRGREDIDHPALPLLLD